MPYAPEEVRKQISAYRSEGDNWIDCNYEFDLHGYSTDTLDIIYTEKYNGCNLPVVTFFATSSRRYIPLDFPSH